MNLPLAEKYDDAVPTLAGADWLKSLRREGFARYQALGLPGPRVEAWKYTNLTRMGRISFTPAVLATGPSVDQVPAGALAVDAPKLVLLNGRLRADLSDMEALPKGVRVSTLEEASAANAAGIDRLLGQMTSGHDMPMLALNTAYLSDGVVIEIDAGANVDTPIHVISIGAVDSDPIVFHPRNVITVGAGAEATIYESHIGLGGQYLNNGVTEIRIAEGALLRHRKLQNESTDAYHVAAATVAMSDQARYENYTLHVGARLARNEIHAALNGRGIDCQLFGAYVGRGNQHIDTTTFVDHAQPECVSREVYKGALDDTARGVFQGKILVRKGAQKTDGHQLNKALLLSEGAEIDAKPELEIYADDVKCSHGATAGELDEEQLFYLRARGIEESEARDLLVAAFLEDSLEIIREEGPQDAFRTVISDWLAVRRNRQEG